MDMTQAQKLFDAWEPIIRKNTGNEIEIRLGKINRGVFDTNVTKETYEKVLRRLRKYNGWESVTETDQMVYQYPTKRRATYDNTLEEIVESIIKKRITVNDISLENKPFDVRLGISSEKKVAHDPDEEANVVRSKKRVSFLRKNLKIDVTHVTGDPQDQDCDDENQYQIELEFVKIPEARHELFNMMYKVFDVLRIM